MAPSTPHPLCAATLLVACVLSGCVSFDGRPPLVLVPIEDAGNGRTGSGIEVLSLTGLAAPDSPPRRAQHGSPRGRALVAAYLRKENPVGALHLYRRLIEEHGDTYELGFTRNAYHEAIRCAWRAGEPELIRSILSEYDKAVRRVCREPEPRFVKDIRRLLRNCSEERLRMAYGRLGAELLDVRFDVLKSDRRDWLKRHETAVVTIVLSAWQLPDRSPRSEVLEQLALAEANLLNGYVRPTSNALLFRDAEARARDKGDTGDNELSIAVTQVFLERTEVVSAPGGREYLLGHDYEKK